MKILKAIGISITLFLIFYPLQIIFGSCLGIFLGVGVLLWLFEDELPHDK